MQARSAPARQGSSPSNRAATISWTTAASAASPAPFVFTRSPGSGIAHERITMKCRFLRPLARPSHQWPIGNLVGVVIIRDHNRILLGSQTTTRELLNRRGPCRSSNLSPHARSRGPVEDATHVHDDGGGVQEVGRPARVRERHDEDLARKDTPALRAADDARPARRAPRRDRRAPQHRAPRRRALVPMPRRIVHAPDDARRRQPEVALVLRPAQGGELAQFPCFMPWRRRRTSTSSCLSAASSSV